MKVLHTMRKMLLGALVLMGCAIGGFPLPETFRRDRDAGAVESIAQVIDEIDVDELAGESAAGGRRDDLHRGMDASALPQPSEA